MNRFLTVFLVALLATVGHAQVLKPLAQYSAAELSKLPVVTPGASGRYYLSGYDASGGGSLVLIDGYSSSGGGGPTNQEIGFGVDGGGTPLTAGLRVKRVVMWPCTIVGWGIVGDVSGSVTLDIRKGTPSGGTVTTSSITASATPALSSAQVATSTTLTGWTTSVAAGDVLELVVTGTPATVTNANITLKITR